MKKDQKLHELFVKLKNNDETALEKIYNEYKNFIYKIAFSILKDSNDAEDIVQNVILKIFKMKKIKLPTTNELSWLYTVVKNEAFTFYKIKNKNDNIDEIYVIKSEIDLIEKKDDIIYYNQIIKKLKPIDQEIVSLKILSDFSFKMISKILNIPIGTVEWRYYKSIKKLKKSGLYSILLIVSCSLLYNNHYIINYKEKELTQISKKKEEIENESNNNQFDSENYSSSIMQEETNTVQNIEIYDNMIQDINKELHQTQAYSMLILLFIIIFIIAIIINLSKHFKLIKRLKAN